MIMINKSEDNNAIIKLTLKVGGKMVGQACSRYCSVIMPRG